MTVQLQKTRKQLIQELALVPDNGKAEIIDGKVVIMSPTGGRPSYVSGLIYAELLQYQRKTGRGRAFPNNAGYLVDLPQRGSFSPDASFYTGATIDAEFLEGAPVFAVEVRSKSDYGAKAEREIRRKILEYLQAGTQVVWDVDVLREGIIRVYRAADPDNLTIYHRGEMAEAEPALPGWTMPVNVIFE
jgi:Uma2 family endonuclease